jgi:DNA primase
MNCEQANQIDLVNYLYTLGFNPQKVRGADYWYLSPLREENEPSFKVHNVKNIWYDHGLAKGGKLIDFVMEYYHCNVTEALKKLLSFHQQKQQQNTPLIQSFQRYESIRLNEANASERSIQIIAAKKPITDLMLCGYLKKRRIDLELVNKYCHEGII